MPDQAAALRQLKKRVDEAKGESLVTRDEFLAAVPRPTPFTSIGLLVPDRLGTKLPPLQHWFSGVASPIQKVCVWDQGGLLAAGTTLAGDYENSLPMMQTVESAHGPITVLPRFAGLELLIRQPASEKFRFIRHLIRNLGSLTEFWITLQAREKESIAPFLPAADGFCVLVPDHPSSLLPGYEAVKGIHLSGSFAPIGLLTFVSDETTTEEPISQRIQGVAKQFLGLDLPEAGMVLSGRHLVPSEEAARFRRILGAIAPEQHDFFFTFAERLLFPLPGEPGSND